MRCLPLLLFLCFMFPTLCASTWGWHTIIDLKDCNPILINDHEHIAKFATNLCDLIGMKAYGKPLVIYFGQDPKIAGFSLVQLIETSLISGHFVPSSNTAYIDIFSCKDYNAESAIAFTACFFCGTVAHSKLLIRGVNS